MTGQSDRLYNLLPAVYRMNDSAQGYPLRALLAVVAEQVNIVEADITQLYENWFIETCQGWVIPYIGSLIGYTPVEDAAVPGPSKGDARGPRNGAFDRGGVGGAGERVAFEQAQDGPRPLRREPEGLGVDHAASVAIGRFDRGRGDPGRHVGRRRRARREWQLAEAVPRDPRRGRLIFPGFCDFSRWRAAGGAGGRCRQEDQGDGRYRCQADRPTPAHRRRS